MKDSFFHSVYKISSTILFLYTRNPLKPLLVGGILSLFRPLKEFRGFIVRLSFFLPLVVSEVQLKMDFRPKAIKDLVIEKKNDFKNTLKEMRRVLKITEKPDREEFVMSAKITGAGMLLIGLIGFAFYLGSTLIPQFI